MYTIIILVYDVTLLRFMLVCIAWQFTRW